jgi:hypothetical protein
MGEKIVEVIKELDKKWFVPSKVPVDGFHRSDICSLSQHHSRRIARKNVEQKEIDHDHSDKNQKSIKYSFQKKLSHAPSLYDLLNPLWVS